MTTAAAPLTPDAMLHRLEADLERRHPDAPVTADMADVHRKRFSTVIGADITVDAASSKVYLKQPRPGIQPTRPTAFPEIAGNRVQLLADTIRDLGSAAAAIGDPRIAAIELLGVIDDEMVLMSAAAGRPLRALVLESMRLRRPAMELTPVFERVGRLLRSFHLVVDRSGSPEGLTDHDAVTAHAGELLDHLAAAGAGAPDPLTEIGRRFDLAAAIHLGPGLPLSARFGDFGLTNILVDGDGSVIAIDSLAAHRCPPLHDACYFVTAFRAISPQVVTLGHAYPAERLDAWEDAFWKAYLDGGRPPVGAIAVWSALRLLDRWAARHDRALKRPFAPVTTRAFARFFGAEISRQLDRAVAAPADPDALRALPAPEVTGAGTT